MKKISIGIDFSKLTFDATIMRRQDDTYKVVAYGKFDNDKKGYRTFNKWVKASLKGLPEAKDPSTWVFCGEHTGTCSLGLCDFLAEKGYDMWLESALVIHRKCGIIRNKDDKADSIRISDYALRHFDDKTRLYQLDSADYKKLRSLYNAHNMLTKDKVAKINQIKSGALDNSKEVLKAFKMILKTIEEQLKSIDKQIKELMLTSDEFKGYYCVITSFIGAGTMTAACLIIITHNFKCLRDARALGCHIGVVPHHWTSGTSVDGKPKVSQYRDRAANGMISRCTTSAVKHNPVIRDYYHRLLANGKTWQVAMNNCKNKVIHIILAMVEEMEKFDIEKYGKSQKERG